MLVNQKRQAVEISHHVPSDQQAYARPPLAGDMNILSSQPSPGLTTTSLQERQLRYLERKRIRQERTSAQMQAIKTTGEKPTPQQPKLVADMQTSTAPLQSRNLPQQMLSPLPIIHHFTPLQILTTAEQRDNVQKQRKVLLRHISRRYLRQDRRDKQRLEHFWITLFCAASALVMMFLTSLSGSALIGYRFYLSTQQQYMTQIQTLRSLMPHDNLKMFDMNGLLIGQLTDQGLHTSVSYDQISLNMINATVATEDKDFWTNSGINIQRIIQAALQDIAQRHVVEGGSTITQQLIKNLVLRNPAQEITRKLQEVMLTPQINSHYSKKDLMEMYLNSIYYGDQAYGVDAAANVYFGLLDQPNKSAASQLDLAQAAMLAGLPSAPNGYDPWIDFNAAIDRLTVVLNLMHRNGYITVNQRLAALHEAQSPGFLKHPKDMTQPAPHFFEFVLEQLQKQFHMTRQQLSLSDMRVYTTLDVHLQDQILHIAQAQIASLQSSHVTNASEVLIDYHTGAVRTLLGNVHPDTDDFDVATQGYRQSGSSFKPYVYVTAFEQGVSPGQAVDDAPIALPQPGRAPFIPKNYSNNFNGHMTLRCALQNSLNIPAIKVMEHVGVKAATKTMEDMGITDFKGQMNDTMVLGSLDLHAIDHTSAMGTFANGGIHVPYYTIQKIEFATTHQVFEHPQDAGTRAISPQLAYMITDVLSNNDDRVPEFGYCNPLNLRTDGTCYGPILPSAAKTGTTNDFRDTWTVGYTSDYVLGVWVGNNDNSPMININGITGAAPIWHDAMLAAEAGHSPQSFTNPGGLVNVEQHYSDGVATHDWFLAGQVPAAVRSNKKPSAATPTSGPSNNHYDQPVVPAQPYCSSYSFDFSPPVSSQQPTDGLSPLGQDWW
jgi:membrane peptidoglycan carboxypeptidase